MYTYFRTDGPIDPLPRNATAVYMTRKEFLRYSAAYAAIPFFGQSACRGAADGDDRNTAAEVRGSSSDRYADHLGLQVFGIRDRLASDPVPTLEAVARIGYKEVEFFDPSTLSSLVPIADDLGMETVATHFLPGFISGKWETATEIGMAPPEGYEFENVLDDCVANGVDYLGVAIMMPEERESLDDYRVFSEQLNRHGEICRAADVQLYYHNHSFELEPIEGTTPLDEMLAVLDPELVKIEFDVFWATIAGTNPIEWIRKLGDRMTFVHMKDLAEGTPIDYTVFEVDEAVFRPLGDGIIDFAGVLAAAREVGAATALVDLDHAETDMLVALDRCYQHIQSLGL